MKRLITTNFITIYLILSLFRILNSIISYGYIHPDEWFQSGEVIARDLFNKEIELTWEFIGDKPIRSIVFPYLYNLPLVMVYYIGKLITGTSINLSGYQFYLIQKLTSVLYSFLIDYVIYLQVPSTHIKPTLLIWSTSYLPYTFLSRPFSNSLETVLVAGIAYLLGLVYLNDGYYKKGADKSEFVKYKLLLGTLLAIGVVNRITFVPFILIFLLISICYAIFRQLNHYSLIRIVYVELPIIISFFATLGACIWLDSAYYNNVKVWDLSVKDNLIITLYNNYSYNSNPDNLSLHGEHPQYLHFLVNLPLLFGPLAIYFIYTSPRIVFHKAKFNWSLTKKLSGMSVFIGTGILSRVRHQEARFILPVGYFIVVGLAGKLANLGRKRMFVITWLLFNSIMFVVFNYLHHSGLLPNLFYVNNRLTKLNNETKCYYYKDKDVDSSNDSRYLPVICSSSDKLISKELNQVACTSFKIKLNIRKTLMPPSQFIKIGLSKNIQVEVNDYQGDGNEEYKKIISSHSNANKRKALKEFVNSNNSEDQLFYINTQDNSNVCHQTLLISPPVESDNLGELNIFWFNFNTHDLFDNLSAGKGNLRDNFKLITYQVLE